MENIFDELSRFPNVTRRGELVTYEEIRLHSYDEFDHTLIDAARIEAARRKNKEKGIRFDKETIQMFNWYFPDTKSKPRKKKR